MLKIFVSYFHKLFTYGMFTTLILWCTFLKKLLISCPMVVFRSLEKDK